MQFSKALLYDIILIAQMFTALTAFSIANFLHERDFFSQEMF